MATIRELAPRVLRRLGVLAEGQQPDPEDEQTAEQKIRAVHASIRTEDIVQWTLADIPAWVEEPYVIMAAVLGAGEYGKPVAQGDWAFGMMLLREATQLRSTGRVTAEYF